MTDQKKKDGLADDVVTRISRVFAVSIVVKLFTFSLGVIVTRQMVPEVKGLSFTLEVIAQIVGFLARESVLAVNARRTFDPTDPKSISLVTNTSAIIPILGAATLAVVAPLYLLLHGAESAVIVGLAGETPVPLMLFALGLMLDMGSEVLQGLVRAAMDLRTKAFWEPAGLIFKLTATFIALKLHLSPSMALGIGWLGYGIGVLLIVSYTVYMAPLKGATTEDSKISQAAFKTVRAVGLGLSFSSVRACFVESFRLWANFFSESILRLMLTEGEKILLGKFVALASQGIFDLVSNLGSLVARMVFRVCEEACFMAVSKTQGAEGQTARLLLLRRMVTLSWYLSMCFVAFGPPLSDIFLKTVYGSAWGTGEAASVLATYCYYVPLLGLNGLTEAFVRGVATPDLFGVMRVVLVLISATYLTTCYVVLSVYNLGVEGLIWTNCASMVLRICFSIFLIAKTHKQHFTLSDVLSVPLPVLIAVVVSAVVCRAVAWQAVFVCGPVVLGSIVMFDADIKARVFRRKAKAE